MKFYIKFAHGEKKGLVSKYLGTFNKKKLPLFEKVTTNLEFLYQTILPFKGMRFNFFFNLKFFFIYQNNITQYNKETLNM